MLAVEKGRPNQNGRARASGHFMRSFCADDDRAKQAAEAKGVSDNMQFILAPLRMLLRIWKRPLI